MNKQKLISFLTAFSIISSLFFIPQTASSLDFSSLVPKSIPVEDANTKKIKEKEVGFKVFGVEIPIGKDGVLIAASKLVISKVVDSTVQWINSGFDGNPAFVTDPSQYFTDLADGIAGEFIQGSDLSALCSPFKGTIKISLIKDYYESDPFECTLSEVVGNIENFYDDFSQGGWDAWFSMTQNSNNNPYGAYLNAKIKLDSRIAKQLGFKNQELDWGKGFLSTKKCVGVSFDGVSGGDGYRTDSQGNKKCIGTEVTVTPGTQIETQLSNVLGTGIRQLELADEFDEIVSALIGQLLQKTIFNIKGLLGADKNPGGGNQSPARPSQIDIDGDGTDDGIDMDGDGALDLCFYGGADGTGYGPPCMGSEQAGVNNPEPGGGAQCSVSTGNQYAGALRAAMDVVLSDPAIANLPNIEDQNGRKANGRIFLDLVAEQINSSGTLNASADILNGNNNPSTGDIIGIWANGDSTMERYDALSGSASTIGSAAMTNFDAFIPLNCTASGGGDDCGCDTGGGGTTPPPPPPPGTPTPNAPAISTVTPTNVTAGQTTIQINGTNLTSTVQFFSSTGARSTVVGSVNSTGTQVSVLVPSDLTSGGGYLRIYKDASTVSNSINIQITRGTTGGGNVTFATPTNKWSPTQTVNGWWPSISPDGQYVAYGNWGDSWVTNLSTKENWNFKTPPGFPTPAEGGGRCMAGQWLSSTVLTFICEVEGAANGGRVGAWRYEVTVGEWVARKTSDDPQSVESNIFRARDGHWASYLAGAFRIVKDGTTVATNSGGAISISGDVLVHACTNDNQTICVRNGTSLSRTYPVRTPMHLTATNGGYIVYGGYGPVHGITPNGADIDLTLSPSKLENPSEIILINGTRWVSTLAWGNDYNYVLLRPWGSRSAIAVNIPATWASVVHKDGNFLIAYNNEVGSMSVVTVPDSSPRHQF